MPAIYQKRKENAPAMCPPNEHIGAFSRVRALKCVDDQNIVRIEYPQMVETKDLRVRMAIGAHQVLKECSENLGYITVAEFVRCAIQEKIKKECYDLIIQVEDIDKE